MCFVKVTLYPVFYDDCRPAKNLVVFSTCHLLSTKIHVVQVHDIWLIRQILVWLHIGVEINIQLTQNSEKVEMFLRVVEN